MTITEENDVTTPTVTVGGIEVPAPPEGLDFRYLSPDGALAKGFDDSLARTRAETEAAMADAARAERAGSQRVHLRLDGWLHSAAGPFGEPAQEPPITESVPEPAEPLPVLPEAQEKALTSFLADHDAEDAREAEAEALVHLAGEEDDQPACDPDARAGEFMVITSNPSKVTCPACQRIVCGEGTPEAEPGTEEEAAPAAEQDDAPAPVAEVSGEPAPEGNSAEG